MKLTAPFPYFGGKRTVASAVWDRFGDVQNYVEPFCGSCALLLARDPWGGSRTETVNDANGFLCNFWRAIKMDPHAVAEYADWPVSEADLHARHDWLMNDGKDRIAALKADPEWFDVKVAGWWVWGACNWIGAGWCDEKSTRKDGRQLADLGQGINRVTMRHVRPVLSSTGRGMEKYDNEGLHAHFELLSQRLRRVRICCGDWTRVLGPTPTVKLGTTAVFLDPPYSAEADRVVIYAEEDFAVAHAVREWALENGDNPELRIALCGYEGEHEMPRNWECMTWKSHGGYASNGKHTDQGKKNRFRERIWFSPHCRREYRGGGGLFDGE